MDIEQLKLILDVVEGTKDSAVWLVILYFFLSPMKIILYFIGWIILIPVIIKGVASIINHVSGYHETIKIIRDTLNVGSEGVVTDDEVRKIIKKIVDLSEK